MTKTDILKLPHRSWTEVKVYDYVKIIPLRRYHSSGFRLIAIAGVINHEPVEIISGGSDVIDISSLIKLEDYCGLAIDFEGDSGVMNLYPRQGKIKAGVALSSLHLTVVSDSKDKS